MTKLESSAKTHCQIYMGMPLDLLGLRDNIRRMTRTYNLSGQPSFGRSLLRTLILAAATIGGLFILAASAAFAFFVAIGLLILGGLTFAFFWTRAKIFGRPFGPKAHFEKARADMEAQFQTEQGPIIDARQTPDGWSVDD